MGQVANAADVFFVAIDPPRGLRRLSADVGRMAELDPKVSAAIALLEERLRGYSPDGQELLGAVLWTRGRSLLGSSGGLDAFRRWIGDGDTVLRTVERCLVTIFSPDVLEEVTREATGYLTSDSGPGAEIHRARDEIQQVAALDGIAVAIVVVVCFTIGYLDGLEDTHPAPHVPSPGVRPEHPKHPH